MQLLLNSWVLGLALASTSEPVMRWFKACRDKNLRGIRKFGSQFLYEVHQNSHFGEDDKEKNWTYNGRNCYEMILFDRNFQPKKHGNILKRFVQLGMPVANYHFQIATSEDELSFLVDAAEQSGQLLDYPTLLCHASTGGYFEMFKRLRSHVATAQEMGQIEEVHWTNGWPAQRASLKRPSTPLLSAVARNQVAMIKHLLVNERVKLEMIGLPNPLQVCLENYNQDPEAANGTIVLLVNAGCDLGPWQNLNKRISSGVPTSIYDQAIMNEIWQPRIRAYDQAVVAAQKRRQNRLASRLVSKVPHDVLLEEGFSQSEISTATWTFLGMIMEIIATIVWTIKKVTLWSFVIMLVLHLCFCPDRH